jgi:hypothetical protein
MGRDALAQTPSAVRVPRTAGPGAAAALLAAAHAWSFLAPDRALLWDQRYYTYFAYLIAEGRVPYRDFFDNKTPLAILMGAAAHRLGSWAGVEPLLAVRALELAIVAAGGMLLFALLKRVYAGSAAAGAMGLLAYCGFLLLGAYPAIGVLPKLRMGVLAWLAALLLARGRWGAAGAAAGLALLDWQVGGLALVALLAAALAGPEGRGRRCASVLGGAALALLPAGLYLLANGALGAAWSQSVASLAGSGEAAASLGMTSRLARLARVTLAGCAGQLWLLAAGIAGLGLLARRLRLLRRRGQGALGTALGVYSYGLLGFTLLDFQGYGDLYPVLQCLALFAGVTLTECLRAAQRAALRAGHRRARHVRRLVGASALALVAALARPVVHGGFSPADRPQSAHPGATLDDQRQVAERVTRELDLARTAFVGTPELLLLSGRENTVPFAYWNRVTLRHYRAAPREASPRALRRLLGERGIDTLVFAAPAPRPVARPGDRVIASRNGSYGVTVRRVVPIGGAPAAPEAQPDARDELEDGG